MTKCTLCLSLVLMGAPVTTFGQTKTATITIPKRAVAPPLTPQIELETTPREVETENGLAAGLFWGGFSVAAIGGGLGLTAKLAFSDRLNDGTRRPAEEATSLRDDGRALALAGDAALITGAAAMGLGTIFWLAGVGETEVEAPDRISVVPLDGGAFVSAGWEVP